MSLFHLYCVQNRQIHRERKQIGGWWGLEEGGRNGKGFFLQNMGNNIYYIHTVHIQLATGLGDCLVRVRGHVSDLMVRHDLIHEYHRDFCWELH